MRFVELFRVQYSLFNEITTKPYLLLVQAGDGENLKIDYSNIKSKV